MAELNGAAGKEVQRALLPGESVVAWARGKGGSHLVATDSRALIVKAGIATGQFFGRKVTVFPYGMLTGAELQTGMFDGYVQLMAAGAQGVTRMGRTAQMYADNTCAFNKGDETRFRHVVDVIRERMMRAHAGGAASGAASMTGELAQLAALHASGALTEEEYAAAKARLLG